MGETIDAPDSEVKRFSPACFTCVAAGVPPSTACGHGYYRGADIPKHPEWKELIYEFCGELRRTGAHSPHPHRPSYFCGAMENTLRLEGAGMPKYTPIFVDIFQAFVSWGTPGVFLFAHWSAREGRMLVTMRGLEQLDAANQHDFEQARRGHAFLKDLMTRGRKPGDKEQFRMGIEKAVEMLRRADLPITQERAAEAMGLTVGPFKTQLRKHGLNGYFAELKQQAKASARDVDNSS